jgi:hypothetical protein
MPSSQTKFERTVSLSLILLGILIACSSNHLLATAFGISLLAVGGVLLRWG